MFPMSSAGSVTYWLQLLPNGDPAAAEQLWQRYFQRLVHLACKKLRGAPRRLADEEDVALSAFDSFFRGAEQGRFPRLNDREDLWQVLMMITARKAVDLIQHEHRKKRGGGAVHNEGARGGTDDSAAVPGLDEVLGREPTPAFAAQVAEELQHLLGLLADDQMRSIALLKMEGYSHEEIGTRVGCAVRTVRRRLRLIRSTWAREQP
jgi:DNA-directed RNA polymerase specialized sigma24 family protein